MERVLDAANRAIVARDRFDVVLAGGDTPRPLYRLLRQARTAWSRWRVWFGDERCLPADHPQRNSAMAAADLLDHVPVPPERVHVIPAQLGPRQAASRYGAALRGIGDFDLVLLGLGEDGHTASLFPGRADGLAADAPDAIPVHASPKPPPERVSLSARRLKASGEVVFLVTGARKHDAVNRLARLDPAIPASAVVPPIGADVWLDDAAAADIRSDIRSDVRSH